MAGAGQDRVVPPSCLIGPIIPLKRRPPECVPIKTEAYSFHQGRPVCVLHHLVDPPFSVAKPAADRARVAQRGTRLSAGEVRFSTRGRQRNSTRRSRLRRVAFPSHKGPRPCPKRRKVYRDSSVGL